jgi:hypothetical protein
MNKLHRNPFQLYNDSSVRVSDRPEPAQADDNKFGEHHQNSSSVSVATVALTLSAAKNFKAQSTIT